VRRAREESCLRGVLLDNHRKMLHQTALQGVAPAAVLELDRAQVRAQVSAFQEFRERVLEQRRGPQVHRVLESGQVRAETSRTEQIANPQRWNQLLAERPHVDDLSAQ